MVPFLSIIILTPLIGAIILLLIPRENNAAVRFTAAFASVISLAVSLFVYAGFDRSNTGMQFTEHVPWIPLIGVSYDLGVDGISLPLVLLTAIIFTGAVFVSFNVKYRVKEFFFYMLVLVSGVFGVFVSRDLLVLFFFFEMAVIPKFILINIWGSDKKEYAALKYTFYMLAGAGLTLIGIIAVYRYASGAGINSFEIARVAELKFSPAFQKIVFLLMLGGFGVVIPIWPLHRWTPDGHSAAPTAISMLLAGVVMKLGGYALIRIAINFFPEGALYWSKYIAVLAAVNAVYIALVALVQKDLKYVVANSSISHMGFVLIGIAAANNVSVSGAVGQMVAHGIMSALFFALVGNIYDRTHTRTLTDLGGLAHQMPKLSAAFLIAGLASLGLPGTFSFIAEFTVFSGAVQVFPVLSAISIISVVITAVYVLKVFQQVFFGPRNAKWDHLKDLKGIEMVPAALLCMVIIFFGIFPDHVMGVIGESVAPIVKKLIFSGLGGMF